MALVIIEETQTFQAYLKFTVYHGVSFKMFDIARGIK